MVSGSDLEVERNTSFNQRLHNPKHLKGYLKLEKLCLVTNIFLEISVLIFDRFSSIQNPQYALIAWEISAAVMFVCVAELIYRGIVKEKMSFLQCLKSLVPCSSEKKPYSFSDGIILCFAKFQMTLCVVSYGCLRQGKQSPVSVSFVSLVFISGFGFYKLYQKRFSNGANGALPVRVEK